MAQVVLATFGFSGGLNPIERASTQQHVHPEIELGLMLSGRLRYLFAGRVFTRAPGEILAFWGALPHAVVAVDEPGEMAWFTVPLEAALAWPLGRAVDRLLRGEVLALPARPGLAEQARGWVAELRGRDAAARATAQLEIEALTRRLAAAESAPRAAPRARAGAIATVEAIAAWIGARFREDIDWRGLRAATGLHPRHAMTVFRRTCGMTVGGYLLRLRLAHACRELATGEANVLAVALDAGFGSLARFYAAFTRAFGKPPARWRREARGG